MAKVFPPFLVALQRIIHRFGLVFFVVWIALTVVYYYLHFRRHSRATKDSNCFVPNNSFEGWRHGLVTILKPEIKKDCQEIAEGKADEIRRVKADAAQWKNELSDNDFLLKTLNCSWVKEYFTNNLYTTKLEHSFPIAFTFLIHNSPQQVVRLLKLLYRPHNLYSIAPDLKSPPEFIATFRNIANCLDNVHIVSKLQDVQWGHRSILEAQMQMYRDLLKIREKQAKHLKWKYVINVSGKELPLNSNHEIVSRLVRLNGTSAVHAHTVPLSKKDVHDRLKHQTIPFSLHFYKSLIHVTLSFDFVYFLFTNSTAIQLYQFFKGVNFPEEHYIATVYRIPNVPGGFNSSLPQSHYFMTDKCLWRTKDFVAKNGLQCSGSIVHDICIVDVGDLLSVLNTTDYGKKALFQNKYFMENDHVIMDCMEERIIAKNKFEYDEDCNTDI